MALSIKPIGDRVVVEAAPAEEKTASGIYIPDTAKEKLQRGTVVAVGTGKVDEPLTVKVGDQVKIRPNMQVGKVLEIRRKKVVVKIVLLSMQSELSDLVKIEEKQSQG